MQDVERADLSQTVFVWSTNEVYTRVRTHTHIHTLPLIIESRSNVNTPIESQWPPFIIAAFILFVTVYEILTVKICTTWPWPLEWAMVKYRCINRKPTGDFLCWQWQYLLYLTPFDRWSRLIGLKFTTILIICGIILKKIFLKNNFKRGSHIWLNHNSISVLS